MREPRTGGFDLLLLLSRLPRQQLALFVPILYASQGTAWSRLAIFPQARMNLKGRRLGPWRGGWDIRRVGIQREVSCRVQREGGSRQSMALLVVSTIRKPARQYAEISGSVTAAAAAFVDSCNGCQ